MVDPGLVAQIDYTSRDYEGYRTSLLTYASQIMPQWTSRSPADFGVMLVELFAYMGDIISFYQDRIVDEGFLATATQRSSVVAIARQLGYTPYPATPSAGAVFVSPTPALGAAYTLPQGTQFVTAFQTAYDSPIFFETSAAATIPAYTTPVPAITVPVTEGRTQGSRQLTLYVGGTVLVEDLGTSVGTVSQVFSLAQQPVILSTVRIFLDDGTAGTEWTVQPDFLLQPSTAQIFTVATNDKGVTNITFGDGVNGAIPPSNLKITASYRIGGGSYGNLPANSIVDLATPIAGIAVAAGTTSSVMSGGVDQETLDSIRTNAPRQFSAQGRAVALADYANLALNVPGVADANAVGNSNNSVVIYALGPNGTLLNQSQLDAIVNYVQPLSLAGVTVSAFNASFVYINAGTAATPVLLGVLPRYLRAAVVAAVNTAFNNIFNPGVASFGQRISLSHMYDALQSVPGVDYVQIPVMARLDLPQSGTTDVLLKASEFPASGTLYMTASGGV